MIININALEQVFELNSDKYFPVHSHIILECVKENKKIYSILCMNQQVMTIEEYINLRRQTANIEINEYLMYLLRTGLKYVILAAPILLVDHIKEAIEDSKPFSSKDNYIFKRNVLIQIERLMQSGELTPHTTLIPDDQSKVPDFLENIFPQSDGVFIGSLLYDKNDVYIPLKSLPTHLGIFGTTGAGKSNLMQVMQHGIIDHNLDVLDNNLTTPLISSLAIDPHDEYALGPEGKGLYHLANLLEPNIRNNLFGSFFYLYPKNSKIQSILNPVSLECVINYEEIMPMDLLNVQSFSGQQSEVMEAENFIAKDQWIENILKSQDNKELLKTKGHSPQSVSAVRRRLRPLERSNIFQPKDQSNSVLSDIVDALESGKILDFNC